MRLHSILIDYSMNLVGSSGKSAVAAAHVMHFVHQGEKIAAKDAVGRYEKLGHSAQGDFFEAQECLKNLL
jgi:hypothetical protein